MKEFRIQLKKISGVAAGGTALIECPTPFRYKSIVLVGGNTAAGDVNAPAVTFFANVKVYYGRGYIREATGAQIDRINTDFGAEHASQAYAGAANGGGRRHLPINFAEHFRNRGFDRDALALQTGFFGDGDKLQIEVTIAAGVTPVLTAYAVVDGFSGGKPHAVMHWDKHDIAAVGSPIQFNNLDRPGSYSQLSVFDTSDAKTIEHVRLVQDGNEEIHDLSKNENNTFLKDVAKMNPNAGAYHVVFDADDDLRNVIPARALQLTATPSAAANGTMVLIAQRLAVPQ